MRRDNAHKQQQRLSRRFDLLVNRTKELPNKEVFVIGKKNLKAIFEPVVGQRRLLFSLGFQSRCYYQEVHASTVVRLKEINLKQLHRFASRLSLYLIGICTK